MDHRFKQEGARMSRRPHHVVFVASAMLLVPCFVVCLTPGAMQAHGTISPLAPQESVADVQETVVREKAESSDPPLSLDELLGLDGQDSADDTARDEAAAELERELVGGEADKALTDIIAKMELAAARLDDELDTGLGTQRVQEDIMKQLEYLLDLARQQDSPSSSSSQSSPSPSQSPQPPPPSSSSPDQQPADGERTQSADSQAGNPPAMQQGDINTVLDEERREWGTLPQRVRQMLLQGRQEKFSSLYEQMTREYYRRLAEEGS